MFSLVSRKFLAMRNITIYSVDVAFVVFLLLTGFVCLVHISDVIFDANQSREYKCSLFSSEISRSCLHWRHHLLFPFLASPNLCGLRCSSIDSLLDYNFMLKIQIRGHSKTMWIR